MLSEAILFPNIDPVAFHIGQFPVRWYALSYIAGIFFGWWYLGRLDKKNSPNVLSRKAYDDFIMWAVVGIILGGRIGYILFYNASYYFSHPSEMFAVWEGGMSFHGGLLGSIAAIWLMSRLYKVDFLRFGDLVACIAPIGLFFGRVANFVNGELYGRITDVKWAVIFPRDPFPRHPSQVYEAILEGAVLFVVMTILFYKTKLREKPGALGGVFLAGYSGFRFVVEFFREPDKQLGFIFGITTMGQILCIPMFILGMYLIFRKRKVLKAA